MNNLKICVCVCTRKRPKMLERALISILSQEVPIEWDLSLIVANNDQEFKVDNLIQEINKKTKIPIYLINILDLGIPYCRNACCDKSVELGADWIIFIDDDEVALPGWLIAYDAAIKNYISDVFTGPVNYIFPDDYKKWLGNNQTSLKKTGRELCTASTNNVMFSTSILKGDPTLRFDTKMALTGGSDKDFFSRYVHRGGKIIAVGDATVEEYVVTERLKLSWRFRRQKQSSANTIYTQKKLFPITKVYRKAAYEVVRRILDGTLGIFSIPFSLLYGCSAAKRSFYHGIRHYAKALGIISGILNRNINFYEKTDGN